MGGSGCPDLGPGFLVGSTIGHYLQVGFMGPDAAQEEDLGWIPPQAGPQAGREATADRTGRRVGLPPAGGFNSGVGLAGVGDLCLPMTEHSRIVYCDHEKYGPVYGSETEAGVKVVKEVVVTGRFRFGGDANSGSGGGTDGKEEGRTGQGRGKRRRTN